MPNCFPKWLDPGFLVCCFFFAAPCLTCRILVPWPGVRPSPPVVEVWSFNHWTAREIPVLFLCVGLWCILGWLLYMYDLGVKVIPVFPRPNVDILFQQMCWKDHSFPIETSWHYCWKSVELICMLLFLYSLSICLNILIFKSFWVCPVFSVFVFLVNGSYLLSSLHSE